LGYSSTSLATPVYQKGSIRDCLPLIIMYKILFLLVFYGFLKNCLQYAKESRFVVCFLLNAKVWM